MLAVGMVLAASLGGFVLAQRGSSASFKPSASWGVFTPVQWSTVRDRVEGRGFVATSIRVVGAVQQHDKRAFALIAAESTTGKTCFVPVHGLKLGRTICRVTKPLLVFTAPDYWIDPAAGGRPAHTVRATDVIGIARRDITGVSVDYASYGRRYVQGLPLIGVSGALTFAGGFANASVLRARNASGRVLVRLDLP
jgi:hypothetical protein